MVWVLGGICYLMLAVAVGQRLRIRDLEQENHDLWGVVLRTAVSSKDAA